MTEYENTAQRYIDSWNETDPVKRKHIIEELYTSDATYTDPLGTATGPQAIDQMVGAVQQQFAGLTFSLGPVDGHHDIARFTWELGDAIVGFDVIVLADGKIKNVHGFLDKVPG
ncbi:nuclear transport factor 2 family protein [Kibdelosporangium aridum]|uniref:SnoaL-like domain-containing protein n=1 Tax=Kibdelosporangium aridum TaxID=2030 RepID=A0A1W2FV47_KIBAR|nr:nuclear transport factor 2 family protein [Kibdelosporangium aridum]SMD25602.1 SnoaL-like domain-containing protein [Kibdelosporangium aridum]